MHASCPAHLIVLNVITLISFEAPHFAVFSKPPTIFSFIGPNILLITLFSNTLDLLSSFTVRYQVSYPYKTTGKITVREKLGISKILN
jgi:hypothetical protein